MTTSEYVFVSYSRNDKHFVDKLSANLRQRGINVWIDVENIMPGTDWQSEIEKGLKGATALILVISKDSVKSKWALLELAEMIRFNKFVLPLIIEDVNPDELPESIRNIQWVDFRKSYEDGITALLNALVTISKSAAPVTPQEVKSKGYAFISYAEEDADFVKILKRFLREYGYAYWDYEESDRDYHSQLFLELEGVIIEASATLSVLSEAWKKSMWSVKEFFFSEEVGTPVFLLKAKHISPTLAIAGMTHIDFTKNTEKGFQKLNRELKRKKL